MQRTKKYMIENYERLYKHADLLDLYLYDTQTRRPPDAVEKHKDEYAKVRVELYRATSAHGGYVVILNSNANIFYLDDINRRMAEDHSVYFLGMRICLERITIARNRAMEAI